MPGWGGCDVCEQESEAFSETLTRLLADDLASSTPGGPVVRVAIDWLSSDDPLALRIHVVGTKDLGAADVSWAAREWPAARRESQRTARLRRHKELHAAGQALSSRAADAPET
jgi:hypothetical protein